ncbi:hypothetical protein HK104_011351, partial [Borealophlyctis nickersoniae]
MAVKSTHLPSGRRATHGSLQQRLGRLSGGKTRKEVVIAHPNSTDDIAVLFKLVTGRNNLANHIVAGGGNGNGNGGVGSREDVDLLGNLAWAVIT